jgi:hypothetical protein
MAKSSIATIRCTGIDMDDVLEDFTGRRVSFPIQYLGLPLTLGRTRMVHLQYIQDRAKGRLAGWQGRLVNMAGRRELVKSVLSSLPVYLLTVIKAPKKFLKEMDKLRKCFLWAGDGELTGGKCKVTWPVVCMPQPNGGLGIKDLDCFGRALRLRWLWHQWDGEQKPWDGLELPIAEEDTALFNAATVVLLGNGNRACFWTSRWLRGESLATRFPRLHKHSKRKNRTVAEAITNGRWIADIDYNLNQGLIADFIRLWEELEGVVLVEGQEDTIVWSLTSDGQYSAKSAYSMQFEGKTRCLAAAQTWKTKAPPKCKFFLWLMLKDRIWTAARLQRRGWPNEYFCQMCFRNLETTEHLFCECHVTRKIWEEVASWIQAPSLLPANWSNASSMNEWFTGMIAMAEPSRKPGLQSITMLTIWEVWRERNNRVFRKLIAIVGHIVATIQDEARVWRLAGNRGLDLLLPASLPDLDQAAATQFNVI